VFESDTRGSDSARSMLAVDGRPALHFRHWTRSTSNSRDRRLPALHRSLTAWGRGARRRGSGTSASAWLCGPSSPVRRRIARASHLPFFALARRQIVISLLALESGDRDGAFVSPFNYPFEVDTNSGKLVGQKAPLKAKVSGLSECGFRRIGEPETWPCSTLPSTARCVSSSRRCDVGRSEADIGRRLVSRASRRELLRTSARRVRY